MGPWCDMDQTRYAKLPRNTVKPCSALGTRQETQQHVGQGSRLPGGGVPGHLLGSDLRTTRPPYEPHTTLPPCRRSTILWPAKPSSRNRCAAPRALAPEAPGHLPRVVRSGCWQSEQTRPEALSTNVCPRLRMVGSTGNGRGPSRSRSTSLPAASAVPSPVISRDDASQHRFRSGVRLHLAHGEVVAQASQASISHAPQVCPS